MRPGAESKDRCHGCSSGVEVEDRGAYGQVCNECWLVVRSILGTGDKQ